MTGNDATAFPGEAAGIDWDFLVRRDASGNLLVSIRADVSEPDIREEYARQAHQAALEVARTETGDIPVHLTLAEPLPLDEARAMAQEIGLQAEHVTLEARDAAGGMHTVGTLAAPEGLVNEDALAPGLEMRDLRLVGVVLVVGKVPASSLPALVDDPRIYMVDTLHRQLARDLAEHYGVPLEDVHMWAPSPFWSLSAERDAG